VLHERAKSSVVRFGWPRIETMKRSLFGACIFLGSASLVACSKSGTEPVKVAEGKVVVTADDHGFTPSSVEVKKGAPVELVFTRTTEDTCATEVVFPELSVKKELPLKTPVSITVPTGEARTLAFQCGMGMYKSKVVVK
jgi:plastocyanin domain-containing protein